MSVVRALTLLLAGASICAAGQPRAFIRVQRHTEPHSCVLAIVAVNGKPLRSPQKELSLPPGRHKLSIRVWLGGRDGRVVHADAPLEQSFKPHRYWIDGEMRKGGLFKLIIEDEDERRRTRARVARGESVEVISNVNAERSAVRSIAWLDEFVIWSFRA